MEGYDYTERSKSRSLDRKSSFKGSISEQLPSDGLTGSELAVTSTTTVSPSTDEASAASYTDKPIASLTKIEPVCTDPLSDISLSGNPCSESDFTKIDFEPTYISGVAQDPCIITNSSSSYNLYDSSSGIAPDSSSSLGPGSGSCQGSGPCPASDPSPGPASDSGPGPASDSGPGPASDSGPSASSDSGPGPASDPGLGPCPHLGPEHTNLRADPVSNYTSWNQQSYLEPQKPPSWEFLQVPEPGARGLWRPSKVEEKSMGFSDTLPRGQCLLNNWEEERATNHLDRVPNMQDGSESFFFRHGHRGLLTLQLQSTMSSSTTQKDSYQPPETLCQPLQGKREAMLEILLHHQICKEVQAEQEHTRKLFETESVTHHDYRKELVQPKPPAPTKSHDYHREQPETFWLQRASRLPGVSYIKTLDTPFRRNCSFTTPVPLSLGQPLPYEPENYSHQLGEMSSLSCQEGGQCDTGRRTTLS